MDSYILSYYIWYIYTILVFAGTFVYNIDSFYQLTSQRKIELSPQYVTIMLNILSSVIRIFWMITIYKGRTEELYLLGNIGDVVLIKLGQVLIFTEFQVIVLVWKTVVDNTQKMKKINKDSEKRAYLQAGLFCAILLLVVFPTAIIGVYYPIFSTISNFLLLLFVIGQVVGGVRYAYQMQQILGGTGSDSKRLDAIRIIRRVIVTFCIMGVICLIVLILNTIGALVHPLLLTWVWWFTIHTCEAISIFLIAYSVSQKIRNENRKTIANSITVTNSAQNINISSMNSTMHSTMTNT